MGTPCTIWSIARRGIKNLEKAREKERVGVLLALFSCEVIQMCIRIGIFWVLENPQTSKLFQFAPVVEIMQHASTLDIVLHMCAYAALWKKPTRLITNAPCLLRLAKFCNKKHVHVVLSGGARCLVKGKPQWARLTALAGAYPDKLCASWAAALRNVAPPRAIGGAATESLDLRRRLEDAAGRGPAVPSGA